MTKDPSDFNPRHMAEHPFGRPQAVYMRAKFEQVFSWYDDLFHHGISTPNLVEDFEQLLAWYWDLTGSDYYNIHFKTYSRSYLPELGYADWFYRLGGLEGHRIRIEAQLKSKE